MLTHLLRIEIIVSDADGHLSSDADASSSVGYAVCSDRVVDVLDWYTTTHRAEGWWIIPPPVMFPQRAAPNHSDHKRDNRGGRLERTAEGKVSLLVRR